MDMPKTGLEPARACQADEGRFERGNSLTSLSERGSCLAATLCTQFHPGLCSMVRPNLP